MADDGGRLHPKVRRWRWLVWSEQGPKHVVQRGICQILFDFLITSPSSEVYPSEATIAVKAGVSEKTIRTHLLALEASGWISRAARGGGGRGWRRTSYKLHFPKHVDPDTDPWLREVERKRLDARDEYRCDEGWRPETDDEAARRAAKFEDDDAAHGYLEDRAADWRAVGIDNPAAYRGLDYDAWSALVELQESVTSVTPAWVRTRAAMLCAYSPDEQREIVAGLRRSGARLSSHRQCESLLSGDVDW